MHSLIVVFALTAGISYRIKTTERYAEKQYNDVVLARTELQMLQGGSSRHSKRSGKAIATIA